MRGGTILTNPGATFTTTRPVGITPLADSDGKWQSYEQAMAHYHANHGDK
jgi:hypothetical protein